MLNHITLRQSQKNQQGLMLIGFLLLIVIIVVLVLLAVHAYQLDKEIVNKFENRRWDVPATVYSRPLMLEKGTVISNEHLKTWLSELDYTKGDTAGTGRYEESDGSYVIHTRGFDYGDGEIDPAQIIKITLKAGKVATVQSNDGVARLEPIEIGRIYPENNEDRVILKKDEVPKQLVDALIATEDRSFYEHYGVSLRGTTRALLSNITGGERQGGSTITQQLIKNFYLTSERTLKRKANEALMALLLERHYSKDAILLTYLNEINLGQNGNQSVNGFALASKFYFNKPISELRLDQYALLVGIAKGSSYYNPRKHSERALARRNTVLHNMLVMGKISQADYDRAIEYDTYEKSGVVDTPAIAKSKFPDFFDAVHRELKRYYRDEDLRGAGLKIISTLDPIAQMAADKAMTEQLNKKANKNKQLQGALVSADPATGELVAIVGSASEFTGFNRAIDSKRQVGSLLKPIIYLTAIQSGEYNWASPTNDKPIPYPSGKGTWTPKNYGGTSHGDVPMLTALANSYNQSAVNVGMEFGVNAFSKKMRQLGVESNIPPYPSVMLGAIDLSPMEVLSVYQVFASGGYHTPIHSIRQVISETGEVLQRTDDNIKTTTRMPADVMYVTNFGLQEVVKDGTATKNMGSIGSAYKLAGKTGTTNNARDAWFAGFSGNYVSVVWVGRDDNEPIGLTGGDGALPIWANYMKRLNLAPVNFKQPKGVTWLWLDAGTGLLSDEACESAIYVPLLAKYSPKNSLSCLTDDNADMEADDGIVTETITDASVTKTVNDEIVYGEVVDDNETVTHDEVDYGDIDEGF